MGADPAAPAGAVVECEVASGVAPVAAPTAVVPALVLVRVFSEPIGMLALKLPADGLAPPELARAIVNELEPELRARFADCGLSWTGELPLDGLCPPLLPSFLAGRARVLREGPRITAAVCTRDRPDGLAVLLQSLGAQEYERLRILVVDNAPSDDRTRRLVAALAHHHDIEYVSEPRPGLSWARNCAIDAADGEVIAWADDDEVCDRWWAAELARGFVEVPEAGAVTGAVIPLELETQSQIWFEEHSGMRAGRGFSRAVISPAGAHRQSPLYPLPPFGIGGNMAFRRDALERIGGFDCALGAGTATLAGEDTAAFSELLLTGGTIVYQPSAIVRHRHRRDYDTLLRLMLGYGRGLSAFYASVLMHRPSCAPELLRLTRPAVRHQLSRHGHSGHSDAHIPRELLRANHIGLLQGAFLYPRARLQARHMGSAEARR
jgi:glycosyltransferase involved in cell wall biosynthesis